jgi:hypothetical protein
VVDEISLVVSAAGPAVDLDSHPGIDAERGSSEYFGSMASATLAEIPRHRGYFGGRRDVKKECARLTFHQPPAESDQRVSLTS